jgi:hypothetical protein
MVQRDFPAQDAERKRLEDANAGAKDWRRWGPYLSERQWGTVREDYSANGDAWSYFGHDQARSRAYRWGEDGIGGLSDSQQRLCLGVALWNGKDPILKERLFGLINREGNHGEDVKEIYYYLDATPTCSYARMLYKYPQGAFPYERLVHENARRGKHDPEFELIDAGLFDEDRYFDIDIEYAKSDDDDILMRIAATNRGPRPRASRCCRRPGFAMSGRGSPMQRSPRCARSATPWSPSSTRRSASSRCTMTTRKPWSSAITRPIRRSCSAQAAWPAISRTPSTNS